MEKEKIKIAIVENIKNQYSCLKKLKIATAEEVCETSLKEIISDPANKITVLALCALLDEQQRSLTDAAIRFPLIEAE